MKPTANDAPNGNAALLQGMREALENYARGLPGRQARLVAAREQVRTFQARTQVEERAVLRELADAQEGVRQLEEGVRTAQTAVRAAADPRPRIMVTTLNDYWFSRARFTMEPGDALACRERIRVAVARLDELQLSGLDEAAMDRALADVLAAVQVSATELVQTGRGSRA